MPRATGKDHWKYRPAEDRFWDNVEMIPFHDCWEWIGNNRAKKMPYGLIKIGKKSVLAHRFSYELHNGPIPSGAFVLHRCNNASCVRPEHLYVGDAFDNMRDKVLSGRHHGQAKTHCAKGHEYTLENTEIKNGIHGVHRLCRECKRLIQKRWRAKHPNYKKAWRAKQKLGRK